MVLGVVLWWVFFFVVSDCWWFYISCRFGYGLGPFKVLGWDGWQRLIAGWRLSVPILGQDKHRQKTTLAGIGSETHNTDRDTQTGHQPGTGAFERRTDTGREASTPNNTARATADPKPITVRDNHSQHIQSITCAEWADICSSCGLIQPGVISRPNENHFLCFRIDVASNFAQDYIGCGWPEPQDRITHVLFGWVVDVDEKWRSAISRSCCGIPGSIAQRLTAVV